MRNFVTRCLAQRAPGKSPGWPLRQLAKPDIVRLVFGRDERHDMIFASDNWAGAHPKVTAALATHGGGFVHAYGNGDLDRAVGEKFNEIFEREVAVFFVGTGTAANSLALTLASKPGGVAFCHREAHAIEDECGAPEYFTGGTRLCPVDGALGRIDPANLEAAIAHYPAEVLALRPPRCRIDHAVDRNRHRLRPRRDRGDFGDLPQGGSAAAYGRRTFRQCAGLARHDAGRDDLEARGRHDFLRRHQERLLVRRGDRAVRPRQGARDGLHPQARGAALLEVALHRRAVRGLFRRWAVAAIGAPRQFAGRQARRPHPRVEDDPSCVGAAGQRSLRCDDV